MRLNQYPLVIAYGYPVDQNEFHFLGRHGVIQIKNHQEELLRILPNCHGYSSLKDICNQLTDIDEDVIKKLINTCERHGVMIDSRQLFKRFHLDSINPGYFMHNLSSEQVDKLTAKTLPEEDLSYGVMNSLPLLDGTSTRVSVRHFSGEPCELETLKRLLASMYRIGKTRSVPSGGGLYPLTLYLVLFMEIDRYEPGIYRHNYYTLELERIRPLPLQDSIERAFDTRDLIKDAVGTIVITADLERSTQKYSNRGYRYTILEAGHVAQNAYLYCQNSPDKQLGIVEYGGFLDEEVANLLGMDFPRYAPIISIMFGMKGDTNQQLTELGLSEQVRQLEAALVGDNKPVVSFGIFDLESKSISMAQWAASAEYRNPNYMKVSRRNETAFAAGSIMSEAFIKVLGEAYERHVCFKPRADIFTDAIKVGNYADPRIFAPYADDHPVFSRYGLKPFKEGEERAWLLGHTHNGTNLYVPSDLIFYAEHPVQLHYCYTPSSTGVAAHPDMQRAQLNAMLELVERDAIAVHWYGMLSPNRISEEFLPRNIRIRKDEWTGAGWEVYILDLTLDLSPVCMVLLVNHKQYPVMSSGAASALTMERAINKAFLEAEYMAISWQKRRKKTMYPEKVRLPDDHGLLYATDKYFNEVEHLLKGNEETPKVNRLTLDDLLSKSDAVTVRMDDGTYPLYVVRVLSNRLMPLTFGFETEHYGHSRLEMLKYAWNRPFPSIPHIFS
jgi:thiazole/oxazole-forming peptide maturase SagD family component